MYIGLWNIFSFKIIHSTARFTNTINYTLRMLCLHIFAIKRLNLIIEYNEINLAVIDALIITLICLKPT